jgi:phosphatidylinositol alpha-1,6-mannosyltransferase
VAGQSGGAPDAVLPGETGHVIDGTDEQQLAEVLIDLLRHLDERARLGGAGRAWVSREWTWEVSVDRLRQILQPP